MKKHLIALSGLLAILMAGCGSDAGQVRIPEQHWKDMTVGIETHPNPPIAGMSEVVVIVTGPRGRPVSDMTVSYRSNDNMPWVQAIQDGRIGVYRRAVDLGVKSEAVLQVQLQQRGEQKTLLYPLKLAAE